MPEDSRLVYFSVNEKDSHVKNKSLTNSSGLDERAMLFTGLATKWCYALATFFCVAPASD